MASSRRAGNQAADNPAEEELDIYQAVGNSILGLPRGLFRSTFHIADYLVRASIYLTRLSTPSRLDFNVILASAANPAAAAAAMQVQQTYVRPQRNNNSPRTRAFTQMWEEAPQPAQPAAEPGLNPQPPAESKSPGPR